MLNALVVDDHIGVQALYKMFLETEGYTVRMAATGTAGMRECLRFGPDLMLLDLRLPDMTGLDVLTHVRSAGHTGVVVIVSGYLDSAATAEAFRLGALACFEKPFRLEDLQATIRALGPTPAVCECSGDFPHTTTAKIVRVSPA